MAKTLEVTVPDIGNVDHVDVVEVLVQVGDTVALEDPVITLESEKSAMDLPSPAAGVVQDIFVKSGDQVGQGSRVLLLELTESANQEPAPFASVARSSSDPASGKSEPGDAGKKDESGAFDIDVVVLGGGPGGYTSAFRAADLGLKVALVEERETLGGVCLNVGCIPSKALLHSAKVIEDTKDMAAHGLHFGAPEIDLDALRQWKESTVHQLTSGLSALAKKRGIEVIRGTGKLLDPHHLQITSSGNERSLHFKNIILATGSSPIWPKIFPADDRLMDSTGALDIKDIPGKFLIVGAGIIGLEMATIYQALGSEITIVEMAETLLPMVDRDIAKPLIKRLEKNCTILLDTQVLAVEIKDDQWLEVAFSNGEKQSFHRILVAAGRRINVEHLNVEKLGIHLTDTGLIAVDEFMRTSIENIFAIGDIVPGSMLAHKATHQGKVAAEVAAGEKSAFDARVIPSVAYTDPEIAWVGLNETEAAAQGIRVIKGVFPWAASGRAIGQARSEGLTKLLFDANTQRIIGGAIVGVSAGELISEVALAIEMGADAEDIALTIHPHPTLSETVAMAAEMATGTITDLLPPRKPRQR